MQTIGEKLSQDERQRLAECERVISQGLKTFVDVGQKLLEIRDSRFYREGYKSFESYCREKWGWSHQRADQYIAAAGVANNLTTTGCQQLPQSERQVRPLTQLPPEQQSEAWSRAQEKAASEGQPVTAKHVEAAVEEIKPKTLDNQFAEAMGFETVEELVRPRMTKEEVFNRAKGRIVEATDFIHTAMTQAYELEEKEWILNHMEAALRRAKHDLEKHHKSTLKAA